MKKILAHRSIFAVTVVAGVLCGVALWTPSLFQLSRYIRTPVAPVVLVQTPEESISTTTPVVVPPTLFQYIEVTDGCGTHFEGMCVNLRSGPSEDFPVVLRMRTGIVLSVADTVTESGQQWYKIGFERYLHYPERITGDLYVAAPYVQLFSDEGVKEITADTPSTSSQRIIVDLSDQKLYAYDGDVLFMEAPISTGLKDTPTPRGRFSIYRKTPSRYMQGPLPGVSEQYFDLPGVPWNLYFTYGGAVIHGAYWHDKFGNPWSHGCVNLTPQNAKNLYKWANIGTSVLVRD